MQRSKAVLVRQPLDMQFLHETGIVLEPLQIDWLHNSCQCLTICKDATVMNLSNGTHELLLIDKEVRRQYT